MPPIPVTVITGFLGSGKTTLLNALLRDKSHGKRIAVIENEYAVELGIENELAARGEGAVFAEVEEVGGACICHGGLKIFAEKMKRLIFEKSSSFDCIVVETTGLADPGFTQIFFKDNFLAHAVRLDSIVTVVDASTINYHLDKHIETGCVNEAEVQIKAADTILINKSDLVDKKALEAVTRRIRAMNSTSRIRSTVRSQVEAGDVLDSGLFSLAKHPKLLNADIDPGHDPSLGSLVLSTTGGLDTDKIARKLHDLDPLLGKSLYRIKGILAKTGTAKKYILQGISASNIAIQEHETSIWTEQESDRRSQIVLIGHNLKRHSSNVEQLLKPFKVEAVQLQEGGSAHDFELGWLPILLVLLVCAWSILDIDTKAWILSMTGFAL